MRILNILASRRRRVGVAGCGGEVSRVDDVEVLPGIRLFQDLTPAELGSLRPAVRRHRLERGAYFRRTGEPSVRAWVLIRGQAKTTMLTPRAGTGDEGLATRRRGDGGSPASPTDASFAPVVKQAG